MKKHKAPDFVKWHLIMPLSLCMQGDFCETLASFGLLKIPIEDLILVNNILTYEVKSEQSNTCTKHTSMTKR